MLEQYCRCGSSGVGMRQLSLHSAFCQAAVSHPPLACAGMTSGIVNQYCLKDGHMRYHEAITYLGITVSLVPQAGRLCVFRQDQGPSLSQRLCLLRSVFLVVPVFKRLDLGCLTSGWCLKDSSDTVPELFERLLCKAHLIHIHRYAWTFDGLLAVLLDPLRGLVENQQHNHRHQQPATKTAPSAGRKAVASVDLHHHPDASQPAVTAYSDKATLQSPPTLHRRRHSRRLSVGVEGGDATCL